MRRLIAVLLVLAFFPATAPAASIRIPIGDHAMPAGDPAGYLPRVQRDRERRARKGKLKSVKGQLIGKVVGKPVVGLGNLAAPDKPRKVGQPTITPNPKASKQRSRNAAKRAYRSRRSA